MARRADRNAVNGLLRTHRKPGIVTAALLLLAPPVLAQDSDAERFSLTGFGTLGVVHSSEEDADFVTDVFARDGAGHSRSWSPEVDSRLGAQLVATVTPRFSATVQLVAEQAHDGDYWPHVEWANIKYQIAPQLSARVGRTALASFLVSDFRKVGYANPWIRPPGEVYGLVPVASADGLDASYRLRLGRVVHGLQGGYGRRDLTAPDGTRSKARNLWNLSDTVEAGAATLRVIYQQAELSIDTVHAAIDGFRQFGAQGIAIADRYDPDAKRVSFVGVGAMYDPGEWFAMAEWGTVNFRSVLGKRTAWYASAGYRIEAFTPYLTFAQTRADSNRTDPGLSLAGLPPDAAASAAMLNGALNTILGRVPIQKSYAAGARWDFTTNVALKVQYDHLALGANSAGTLSNVQPAFQTGGHANLFSAAIDFVW